MSGLISSSELPLERPCASPDEVWAWLRQHLGLSIPRSAVCAGHQAPFDYLCNAYFEPAGDLIVWAPRGGGKTRLAAAATLLDLLHKPGIQVRILGGSLDQSLRMWEHLAADVDRLADALRAGRPRARRIDLVSGSSVGVLTQSQRSVRGVRVQKLRCDEAELFDPRVWEAAQLVTRSAHCGMRVAGTIEAASTLHLPGGLMQRIVDQAQSTGKRIIRWCLLEVLERCDADRPCDGCLLHEDCGGAAKTRCEGFVSIEDAIAMKQRVSRSTWESEMLCRRPAVHGAVFPEFDPQVHVRPASGDAPERMTLAMDFGFNSPLVCLWIAECDDGRIHVLDEHVRSHQRLEVHLAKIEANALGRAYRVACDPAGAAPNEQTARSNIELLKQRGYSVLSRKSRIVDGVEMIRAALCPAAGSPRLFVHPRCRKLIQALVSYRYPEGGGERPLKDGVFDHPIDALRYYFVNAAVGAVAGRGY